MKVVELRTWAAYRAAKIAALDAQDIVLEPDDLEAQESMWFDAWKIDVLNYPSGVLVPEATARSFFAMVGGNVSTFRHAENGRELGRIAMLYSPRPQPPCRRCHGNGYTLSPQRSDCFGNSVRIPCECKSGRVFMSDPTA